MCSASKQRRVNVNNVLLEEEIESVSHSSGCSWMMGRSLPSTTTEKGEFWIRQFASWLQNRTGGVTHLLEMEGEKIIVFPFLDVFVWLFVTKSGTAPQKNIL